jgi:hypothetical protein
MGGRGKLILHLPSLKPLHCKVTHSPRFLSGLGPPVGLTP